jgi:hypothetical protein
MTTAPMNPKAGVSGPGKYSVRTDKLNMGSTSYGEGVETQALKSGAPLANTPDVRGEAPSKFREGLSAAPVTELFAPSERPDEPITTGIARGAGAGPEVLMMQSQFAQRKISDILAEMIPYDNTGEVAILYQNAIARGN